LKKTSNKYHDKLKKRNCAKNKYRVTFVRNKGLRF
jgi:hypothetical protein